MFLLRRGLNKGGLIFIFPLNEEWVLEGYSEVKNWGNQKR